jgi:hypothetical protein
MNMPNKNLELCRQLINELPWNELDAQQSARIATSKAIYLGVSKQEVEELIHTVPSASYLRQNPHILFASWACVAQAMRPDQHLSDFERLLNSVN